MKVAVPLFNLEVAPRFGFADRFLVAEVQGREIVECRSIPLRGRGIIERLEEIRNRGVRTLLCGGFNRNFIPYAKTLGMTVHVGLSGPGIEILSAFASRSASQPSRPLRCKSASRRRPI